MSADKFDALGPLLSEVGLEAVAIAGGDATGLFLYVEAGEVWVGASLFKDEGEVVRYLSYKGSSLTDHIFAARESEPDVSKRWSVMEYEIENGKFEAKFKFADEIDVESDSDIEGKRRDGALRARYGDKPVVYPPPPFDAMELTSEG